MWSPYLVKSVKPAEPVKPTDILNSTGHWRLQRVRVSLREENRRGARHPLHSRTSPHLGGVGPFPATVTGHFKDSLGQGKRMGTTLGRWSRRRFAVNRLMTAPSASIPGTLSILETVWLSMTPWMGTPHDNEIFSRVRSVMTLSQRHTITSGCSPKSAAGRYTRIRVSKRGDRGEQNLWLVLDRMQPSHDLDRVHL